MNYEPHGRVEMDETPVIRYSWLSVPFEDFGVRM